MVTRRSRGSAASVLGAILLGSTLFATSSPVVAAPVPQTSGRILCVNIAGGTATAPCTNATAYRTIQAAVDAARSGDEIRIAKGTYTSTDPRIVEISDKSLSLVGGFSASNWTTPGAASETVIDGQDQRQGISVSGAGIELAHLTLTRGRADIGGAMYVSGLFEQPVVLFDVVVRENTATSSGGGLFVATALTIIEQTQLTQNVAEEDGGAFFGLRLEATDSEMTNNTGARNGGAAHVSWYSTFERTLIANNKATAGSGGALYVQGDTTLSQVELVNNTAGEFGGGLYNNYDTAVLDISDSVVADNAAARAGGGIYAQSDLQLEGVDLSGNRAQESGGGIFQSEGQKQITVVDSVIEANTSGAAGGGMFAGGNAALTDSLVRNNEAAQSGGGIAQPTTYRGASTTVALQRSVVEANRAIAGSGGGVFVLDRAVVDQSLVVGNQAGGDGGGIYQVPAQLRGPNELNVTASVIAQNTTAGAGGGMSSGGNMTLDQVELLNNAAGNNGGGAYSYGAGNTTVVGSVLGNNRAGSAGDGLFVDNKGYASATNNRLTNVTIASAERAPHEAVRVEGTSATLSLVNTAIASHAVGVARAAGSTLSGNYNAFFNNGTNHTVGGAAQPLPFANVVTADPEFVDPASSDFHLRETSPLIDKGDPTRNYANQRDVDGRPVPYGARADIGADEWAPVYPLYVPMITR